MNISTNADVYLNVLRVICIKRGRKLADNNGRHPSVTVTEAELLLHILSTLVLISYLLSLFMGMHLMTPKMLIHSESLILKTLLDEFDFNTRQIKQITQVFSVAAAYHSSVTVSPPERCTVRWCVSHTNTPTHTNSGAAQLSH